MTSFELHRVAWDAFWHWCSEHDPDGDLDPMEQVEAYSKWAAEQWRLQHGLPAPNGERG